MGASLSVKTSSRRQRGLSVVELLISLVIGMAVIGGAIQVVVSSKRSFMDQDEVTFIQTNARFAMDILSRDIRMAGYLGCAAQQTVDMANAINSDLLDEKYRVYVSLEGLRGFEGEAGTDDFPEDYRDLAASGADSLLIRRGGDIELNVQGHNSSAGVAALTLSAPHNYASGSTLVIADASCRNIGLFEVSGPAGLPAYTLEHKGTGTHNCTSVIKGNFSCLPTCNDNSCDGYDAVSAYYSSGSKLMELVSHAYYIGESDAMPGMPALRRQVFNAKGPAATHSEEIALGVEDMEILYGLDADGNGEVDQMRKASDIEDGDWGKVISVKISLVFRSQLPVLPVAEKKTLAGTEYNDRYMRQVVNSTVRIRNRG
jgi:type IV pilus assembly protein PilW